MPRRTAEEADKTRQTMLEAGVQTFAEKGYAGVALEELMETLGVTRGAVYHHFRSKKGFFHAIVEHALRQLSDQILKISRKHGDGWEGIEAGCFAFLKAATEPMCRQIVIVDGPAVLGWPDWKALDDKYLTSSLREGFEMLRKEGKLCSDDPEALAVALSGAMNELALWVAHHPKPKSTLKRARGILRGLLSAYQP